MKAVKVASYFYDDEKKKMRYFRGIINTIINLIIFYLFLHYYSKYICYNYFNNFNVLIR